MKDGLEICPSGKCNDMRIDIGRFLTTQSQLTVRVLHRLRSNAYLVFI